jgi:hypothetical protein
VPFSCSVDRIDSSSTSANLMYLSNAYLDEALFGNIVIPAVASLGDTNSESRQLENAYACAATHGTAPNFLLSDYSQMGDYGVMKAAATLNGVEYTEPTSSATSRGSGSGSGSGSSSGGSNGAATSPRSLAAMAMGAAGVALLTL